MQNNFLGVLIAICGNSLIGTSFAVMKIAHMSNTGGGSYLKIPMWWFGTALMITGELGNLVAYSLAKPSLISPLGAVSVVVNVPVAYFILGEQASYRNVLGCLMCVLGGYGIVGVVANGAVEKGPLTVEEFERMAFSPSFMVFLVISAFESLDLIWSKQQTVMSYITVCSLLGGVTVLSIKAVTSFVMLTLKGQNQMVYPTTYGLVPILVLTMALQVQYLNKAIAEFGTGEVVPTYYVIFTSWAVLGSAILYGDLKETTSEHLLIFVLSFCATSAGVYLVAYQQPESSQKSDASVGLSEGDTMGLNLLDDDLEALL